MKQGVFGTSDTCYFLFYFSKFIYYIDKGRLIPIDKLLRSAYSRRLFYIITCLLLIIVALMRFLVVPLTWDQPFPSVPSVISSVLDAVFATGLSTATVGWLIFWLTPKVMGKSDLTIVEPHRIGELLEDARDTDEYWFSGGTGSFTKSVTLRELANKARRNNVTKQVNLLILDPSNKEVCQQYADYRRRVRTGTRKPWSVTQVRNQLLATVVAAYVWQSEQPLLKITIGLKNTVSLFRIDLSSKLAVVTKEDPKEPGLTCASGTFFHTAYREELRLVLEQSKKARQADAPTFNQLTPVNVRELLAKTAIYDSTLTDGDLDEIMDLARGEEHAYG